MNLFILHKSPRLCARYYFNSHVIKIILEAVQMLYAAKAILDPNVDYSAAPTAASGKQYKITHRNHPVTIWVRTSKANWDWTCELVEALIDEWHYRYQHDKVHGCYPIFKWLQAHPPTNDSFPAIGLGEFAQAMPDEYKVPGKPIAAYRKYYRSPMKAHIAQWKNRSVPHWFNKNRLIDKNSNTTQQDVQWSAN
jgi:hypothetical protein